MTDSTTVERVAAAMAGSGVTLQELDGGEVAKLMTAARAAIEEMDLDALREELERLTNMVHTLENRLNARLRGAGS